MQWQDAQVPNRMLFNSRMNPGDSPTLWLGVTKLARLVLNSRSLVPGGILGFWVLTVFVLLTVVVRNVVLLRVDWANVRRPGLGTFPVREFGGNG